MQFLASKFRSQPAAQPTGAEMVEKYCDRATHATLIEDRRAAVLGLKGLAHEYKLDVGIKGMSVLLDILNQDIMDTEITKAVLEALTILCSPEDSEEKENEGSTKDKTQDDLSIQFTEILIKDPKNVTTLLQALEGNDFYVRYFTIQLLNALMNNKPDQLQTCILTSPMGVSRLIDLLDDKREIIRNEGLLLLISLSRSNAEIQKIIAFENAFEKLLGIILQEGVTDGGIVVQDCLQLTHNLLRYNVSNQNLFRESSCIQILPKLLVSRVQGPKNTLKEISLTDPENEWTDQKIVNATLILGLIRILVVPNNPNTTVNQNVMYQCKIMDILIDLAFCPRIPNKLKCQAFYAIADIIRGNTKNQDSFAKNVIKSGEVIDPTSPVISSPARSRSQSKIDLSPPSPILLVLVQIILTPSKNDDFSIRAAAAYTFQCYVNNNPDGQLALLTTLMPPPEDNPNDEVNDKPQTPGTIILSSLLEWNTTRKDPYKTWFAAVLLSHILMKNEQCKLMALKLNLYEYDEQISLLHKCMYSYITATKENVDVRVLIGFLCLLSVWLYDCPKAVSEFLKEGAHISILIEEIIQSSNIDIAVQGLAAFLFSICYEFNDGSEPSFTREKIQPIVLNRIGADVFISRFERLKESEYIEKVSPYLQIISKDKETINKDNLPNLYFDYSFIELFKSSYDNISRSIIEQRKDEPDTVAIQMLKNKIESLEKKINDLNKEAEEKEKKYEELIKDNESYQSLINKQNDEIKQKNEKISSLENQLLTQNEQSSSKILELENQLKAVQLNENPSTSAQKSQQIESENYTSNLQLIELTKKNNELIQELEKQKQQYQELEQEQDDLLVCLAEHDLEIKKLKIKLIGYGEKDIVLDDDDDEDEDDNDNEDDININDNNGSNSNTQEIQNTNENNNDYDPLDSKLVDITGNDSLTNLTQEIKPMTENVEPNQIQNNTNSTVALETPISFQNNNDNAVFPIQPSSTLNQQIVSEQQQPDITQNSQQAYITPTSITDNSIASPQNIGVIVPPPANSTVDPSTYLSPSSQQPNNTIPSPNTVPLTSPGLTTFTPPPLSNSQDPSSNTSTPPPPQQGALPPPPSDLLIQQQGGYSYNNRRHNRHQYANYVPNVSFLPQTQFNNNPENSS